MLMHACVVLSLALVSACGPVVTSEPTASRCLSLDEPDGSSGLVAALPSRVSWLFKLDTCGGDPVSALAGAQFDIFEDGKKVSAFESQQRISPKGERFRLYSVVLLDLSGSMLRSGDFAALQTAAGQYLETALAPGGDGHRVALMTFDGRERPQTVVPFTSDKAALRAGLESLSVSECTVSADCAGYSDRRTCAGWRCVDDSTNLNGAVAATLQTLDAELARAEVPWRDSALVVFTDGTDQAGRVSSGTALEAVKDSPAHVFTIGLGGEVDEAALRTFGKDGYVPVADASELAPAFTDIASRVSGLANRFFLLEYCSPKRGGTHTLEVKASLETDDGLLTGTLTGSFDATGFSSGCEL